MRKACRHSSSAATCATGSCTGRGTDIDVVVAGSGIEVAEAMGRRTGSRVSVFKNFGTAMLRCGAWEVEFVGARKESYRADSRKPIVEDGTIEDDQLRRDFTINAMAFSLNAATFGELVDPFDGTADLERRLIRTPCDPDVTFSDDPLRMIRRCVSPPSLASTSTPKRSTRSGATRSGSLSYRKSGSPRN